jgi:homoserine dehydrogenase
VPEGEVTVGLVGLGTIGAGVVQVLQEHGARIDERLGFRIRLKSIAEIDLERERPVALESYRLTRDWKEIVADPEVDIVVELIGGSDVARSVVLGALEAGKRVVTANKALLALHGKEIYGCAVAHATDIAFEASVAGTIPVLRALREGLCGDRIDSVHGILNGTCNFILSEMEQYSEAYEPCLKRAQDLGYAEADPTFDVNGMDSTHKLTILLGLAFGMRVLPEDIPTEGIQEISAIDIDFASRFGLRIKLLAVAKDREGAVEARVHPTMIPKESVLAGVNGSMNAVEVRGRMSGPTLYCGAGAGSEPTASAVVADLMELARGCRQGVSGRVPALGTPLLREPSMYRQEDFAGEYYLRFTAVDRPGVLSRIAGALGEQGVSIASVLQMERDVLEAVPVVMVTHPAKGAAVRAALREIDRIGDVTAPTQVIPIEREI